MIAFVLTLSAAADPGVDAVNGIVHAVPIVLGQPYRYTWTAEQPEIVEATALVIDADPDWLVVHQVGDSVLYVGAVPAERVNRGGACGRAVVLVPGAPDPTQTLIYFGPPDLPERVDAAAGARALAGAAAAGATPHPVTLAPEQSFPDAGMLYRTLLADLVMAHCPQEASLAEAWRR